MKLLARFGKNYKWRIHETFLYWLSVIISAVYFWGKDYPLAISIYISCGNLSETSYHKTRAILKACLFSKLTINILFPFTPDENVCSPRHPADTLPKHEESHSTFINFEWLLCVFLWFCWRFFLVFYVISFRIWIWICLEKYPWYHIIPFGIVVTDESNSYLKLLQSGSKLLKATYHRNNLKHSRTIHLSEM